MDIIRRAHIMQQIALNLKKKGNKIGFVPTMGALHFGHLSLVRKANQISHNTIVSIFVNPLQFGPNEDYDKYPRDLTKDADTLKELNVDYIFAPDVSNLYTEGFSTEVINDKLGNILCGKSRPGHFKGVLTVVAKLFNIVQPDFAIFGQKDYQQLILIKRMVQDLNFPVEIISCPIVRESDGLAMSSRNSYLSPEERKAATILYKSIQYAEEKVEEGEDNLESIKKELKKLISKEPLASIDYIETVNPTTLEPVEKLKGEAVLLLAIFIGKTRLIDNTILREKKDEKIGNA
jgi:pantoate--beta-alanine ligase